MFKILIDDDIGMWGITPKAIRDKLEENTNKEDILLEINSGGGSVFSGIEIFNILESYAKEEIKRKPIS